MPGLGEAILKISADISGLTAGLNAAGAKIKNFATQSVTGMQKFGNSLRAGVTQVKAFGDSLNKIGGQLQSIAGAATGVSLAIAGMMAPIVLQGAGFEQAMANVKAVVGSTRDDFEEMGVTGEENFKKLSDLAKELGASTKFSASQVAEAMSFLGMAGFDTNEILASTQATLNLAAAGNLDLAEAADIASNVVTGFGLTAADAGRVMDVMAKASANSNTDIRQLGEALSYVAPVAAATGVSVEETTALIGKLSDAGIQSSRAGTGLLQIFSLLQKGGDQAAATLAKYGLTLDDVNPAVVGATEAIRRLGAANIMTGDMMELFGQRAGPAATILKTVIDNVDEFTESLHNASGEVLEMADIQSDTLLGSFKALMSAVKGLNNAIFEAMGLSLRSAVEWMTGVVNKIREWVEANQPLVQQIGSWISAIGVAAGALAGIAGTLGIVISAIGGLISAVPAVAGVISIKFIAIGAAITAAIAGVVIPIIMALKENWDLVVSVIQKAYNNVIKPIFEGFMEVAMALWENVLKPVFEMFKAAIKELLTALETLFGSFGEGSSLMKTFGKILGVVAAIGQGPLLIAITAVVAIFRALAWVVRQVTDAYVKLARYMGFASKEMKTSEEIAARQALLYQRNTEDLKRATAQVEEFMEANSELTEGRNKMLAIMEKGENISATEARTLAGLIDKYGELDKAGLQKVVAGYEKQHAAMTLVLESARANGEVTREQELAYKKLDQQLTTARAALERFERGESNFALTSAEAARAHAKAVEERAAAFANLEAAGERLKKSQSEMEKIEKELRTVVMEGLKGELAGVEALRAEREALLRTRLADLQASKASMEVLGQDTSGIAQEIRNVKELIALNEKKAKQEKRRLVEEQKLKERDFARDSDIEEAKRRGDKVRAAQLEAQKLIEVESEKIDKLFELDKKRAEEEKRRVRERARDLVRKAVEEEEKERDGLIGAAEREKNIEESATDQLIKRVSSVRDLIMLYTALAQIRQAQEQRAAAAAVDAVKGRQQIAALEERLAATKGEEAKQRLQNLIEQKKALLGVAEGVAGKRAGEAGLEGLQADQFKAERAKITEELRLIDNEIAAFKARLQTAMEGTAEIFSAAAVSWVNAAVASWQANAQQIVDAVRNTMSQVNMEMAPTTRHSPSLVDIWGMNVDAVKKGANRMVAALQQVSPEAGMRRLNSSAVVPAVGGMSGGGFEPSPSVKELNDNRRVDMTVNNNVDAEDLKRRLGLAVGDAMRGAGGV